MKSFLFDALLVGGMVTMLLTNHYGSLKCAYDSITVGSDCKQQVISVTNQKW